ncbi:hypothetical protein QFZ48_002434 [Chitinophaga sp. W2I13]|uniref:hypothetical protein n=1 Tax=Chitinophaga sp. W2I13 TaxID=3373923 RepID=UPI003D20BC9A
MKIRTLLFVTSYPPRECGIATFAQDLVNAMNKNFAGNLNIEVAALEEAGKPANMKEIPVTYSVNPFDIDECIDFAQKINENDKNRPGLF